jgi:hypothetical protein
MRAFPAASRCVSVPSTPSMVLEGDAGDGREAHGVVGSAV